MTEENKHVQKEFSRLLMRWNQRKNNRQMPWKGEKDPYKIWLSEIILQQTRVEQGLAYYHRFIASFPTVNHLAEAHDSLVFKHWEGLGYYSRCRNLLTSARYISRQLGGRFPSGYEDIRSLKGVGPYTAAAIASFAYNLPYAVVDGNVFRVLSRVFGVSLPIDSTEGKKYFNALAGEVLDKRNPGVYNQAIMDFGATVCKPAAAACETCVFNKICFAFIHGKINELPVKEKKPASRKRYFYYLVMDHKGSFAIRQRNAKDIWNQLHEFPLIETGGTQSKKEILAEAEKQGLLPAHDHYEIVSSSEVFRQQLTHQSITGQFIRVKLKKAIPGDWNWISKKQMARLAFPKFINQYLQSQK